MKNKSKLLTILTIIIILCSISWLIGIILSIISTRNIFNNVKLVSVIEVNDKTIKVQISEKNGNPIIYELKRYKIFNIKENDNIYVKLKEDKVNYSIKPFELKKFGILLIEVPMVILILMLIFCFIFFQIYIVKGSKIPIKEKIIYIAFFIGFIILILL